MDSCEKELFTLYKSFDGSGKIHLMKGVDKTKPDFKAILTLATLFARDGSEVKILTSCHFKSSEYSIVFSRLLGTKFERKCPDFLIDGQFYEYEGFERPWNKRKISNMLSHGLSQSDRIIIDNTKGASDRFIRKAIMARLNMKHAQICEVWLYEKGRKRLFFNKYGFIKTTGRTSLPAMLAP